MATCCRKKEKKGQNFVTFLFFKKVLAFGKFSPKKMTNIYRQFFFLGGEFLHHGEEKEKNIKHSVT
jgi:hypothetical protein